MNTAIRANDNLKKKIFLISYCSFGNYDSLPDQIFFRFGLMHQGVGIRFHLCVAIFFERIRFLAQESKNRDSRKSLLIFQKKHFGKSLRHFFFVGPEKKRMARAIQISISLHFWRLIFYVYAILWILAVFTVPPN